MKLKTLNQMKKNLHKVATKATCDNVWSAYWTAKNTLEWLRHYEPKNAKEEKQKDQLEEDCYSVISWADYWSDRIA